MSSELRIPDRVGIVAGTSADDDVLYVASLPDGPIVVLRDTALTIWHEAVAPTGEQDLVERVAGLYGVPVSEVEAAVGSCVADLVERGILEVVPGR
jgi:hypothetical protein